jgi:predicted nuclease of predicted toxin-antitoxin system
MPPLLDENLSESVGARISSEFPRTEHVRRALGAGASDQQVWEFAKAGGHILVTLDQDVERLCVARGAPPKVILVDAHNAKNSEIAALLASRAGLIRSFESDPEAAILVLRLGSV